MGIHTEENKDQSEFNLDRMLERMKQIIEESLNNCADHYLEEDEQLKEPTEEGCTSETAEGGVEKTAVIDWVAATERTERVNLEKKVEAPIQWSVNVLPGNTLKMPSYTWKYIRGRAADEQATHQRIMPRRNADDTGERHDLETHMRRRKYWPWLNDPPIADHGPLSFSM